MAYMFDYTLLRIFIEKHFQSEKEFAQFLGISEGALQARLQSIVPFTQWEIDVTACYATNKILTADQIHRLFFTHAVRKA